MGVDQLTTFIGNKSDSLLEDYELFNKKVVIDGNSLAYHLYLGKDKRIDDIHGGNYQEYQDECIKFFEVLEKCRIKPYVLLDGANDAGDAKIHTIMDRAKEKTHKSLSGHKGTKFREGLIPLFAHEVFTQTMVQKRIPYTVCDFEADNDIVALANELRCPVIADDSDFFIFDITAGYIPIAKLQWRDIYQNESDRDCPVLKAKIYHLKNFLKRFRIPKEFMPVFANLVGNDYIPGCLFVTFYHTNIITKYDGGDGKIMNILDWLSGRNVADVKREMFDYMKQKLENALEVYDVKNGSKFLQCIEGGSTKPKMQHLPDSCTESYRRRKLTPSAVNVITNKRLITRPINENIDQPSCNKASVNIRKSLYGILLKEEIDGDRTGDNSVRVTEYIRKDGEHYQVPSFITLKYEDCSTLPSLGDIQSASESDKKAIISKTLKVNTQKLDDQLNDPGLRLPMAVTIYWIKNANPKVFDTELHALLRCFHKGYFESAAARQKTKSSESFLCKQKHCFQAYAQWQSCMYYASYLNSVLGEPYPMPDMTKLYEGLTIHQICETLESTNREVNLDNAIKTMFAEKSSLRGTYRLLYDVVDHQLKPGELQTFRSNIALPLAYGSQQRNPSQATYDATARTSYPASPSQPYKRCYRCGGPFPHAGDCPAKDSQCTKCRMKGHFTHLCKNPPYPPDKVPGRSDVDDWRR
ncbi:single-strand DNA endonuclease ASTE1-like [Ptychodera flava]|uniref:single-strand DNA endonuclease ASTE1-like n=1 Tax=Ptychodera flava TaxID=63121 RepID=UPI00396A06D2